MRLPMMRIEGVDPKIFVTTSAGPSFLFPIWTTFWAVYHAVVLLLLNLEIVYSSQAVTWYLDLTYWTNSLVVISSVCDCFATLFFHSCRRHLLEPTADTRTSVPWYMQMVWIFYNTSNTAVLTSTLLLGSLLPLRSDPVIFLIQIVSPVYVIANVIVSAKETRILHLYQPASFLLLYILTNMAHCLATGSRVYALLNWAGSPVITIAISLGILLVFTPLLHMFVYGLFRLRTYLIDAYRELLENGDDVI